MTDTFLSRWSRLKAESKGDKAEPAAVPTAVPPGDEAVEPAAEETLDLPPIQSLTKESDFAPFLRAGVPEDLRKAALSRLWASDPLFSRPEIYDLHMEDYSQPALAESIETAWKFGRGMLEGDAAPVNFPDIPEETQEDAAKDNESPAEA